MLLKKKLQFFVCFGLLPNKPNLIGQHSNKPQEQRKQILTLQNYVGFLSILTYWTLKKHSVNQNKGKKGMINIKTETKSIENRKTMGNQWKQKFILWGDQ